MTNQEMLNILRNPGWVTEEKQKTARLRAASLLERYIQEQSFTQGNQRRRVPTMDEARHMREFKYK